MIHGHLRKHSCKIKLFANQERHRRGKSIKLLVPPLPTLPYRQLADPFPEKSVLCSARFPSWLPLLQPCKRRRKSAGRIQARSWKKTGKGPSRPLSIRQSQRLQPEHSPFSSARARGKTSSPILDPAFGLSLARPLRKLQHMSLSKATCFSLAWKPQLTSAQAKQAHNGRQTYLQVPIWRPDDGHGLQMMDFSKPTP